MAKAKMSLEAYKKRDLEVQALLASITPAISTIVLHEPFLKQSRQLEKIIKRLKAFLRMLSTLAKLNPLRYGEWWHNAYAKPQKVSPQIATPADVAKEVATTLTQNQNESVTPTLAPAEKTASTTLPPRFFQQ